MEFKAEWSLDKTRVRYTLKGDPAEVQVKMDMLFDSYPYDEYQTFVTNDDSKKGVRTVVMERYANKV